jgi:thiamine kinase-like enzyme
VDNRLAALRDQIPLLAGDDITIAPLDGGITNHNYRVDRGDERLVLRIGGEGTQKLGVDRAAEYACSLAAMEAGVGADVLAYLPEANALVTRFVAGRVLTPEDMTDESVVTRVADALRRFHAVPWVPGRFSPFVTVRTYHARALAHGVAFPVEMDTALQTLSRIEVSLTSDDPPCPCHNDLLPANLLDDGNRVRIIDWEYAGMGDRFFDLGNLAANTSMDETAERALLAAYFGTVTDDHRRRLHLMRLASEMRESLWGYLQSGISSLDFDFRAYGEERLDRFLAEVQRLDLETVAT